MDKLTPNTLFLTPPLPNGIVVCGRCHLPVRQGKEHDFPEDCIRAKDAAFARLLAKIGTPRACKGCNATIWMVRILTGESKPYDAAGSSHFLTCPKREEFTGKKG